MARVLLTGIFLALTLVTGCARQDSLNQILDRGKLQVISRNSPTTWYVDKNGPTGFEYALASLFAQELGVELAMSPAFSLADIFTSLARGEADFAAAGLTLTGERQDRYPHSAPYYQLTPQVVYRAGSFRPRNLEDLADLETVVLADSSHAQALAALREGGYTALRWREIAAADSMRLLEEVNDGKAAAAVIDSNEFEVQQRLFPRLKVAFELGSDQEMVWYLPPARNNERLLARIDAFLAAKRADGTLEELRERFFGNSRIISRIGSHTFSLNMRSKLPEYRSLIDEVAREYQMDWHLLAAIAYQESHWDPRAESPTGVRGMMMLTAPTAREMGVTDRTDPGQSLRGGARYFKNLKRRLPRDIYEPDRTYMALAAYNIGLGHLEDARVLTERRGGDPHRWQDLMENLPLLENSRYYESLRYGYARGREAARYVQNIRHYQGILEWQDIADNTPLPPIRAEDYLPEVLRGATLRAL